jgi:hypothetical protein
MRFFLEAIDLFFELGHLIGYADVDPNHGTYYPGSRSY